MYLRNTSSHPDNEVRSLVKFAAEPYDLRFVCVNVKGSGYAFRGRAYSRVPRRYSNAPRSAQRLVVIAIGPADKFGTPKSNVHERWAWKPITEAEFLAANGVNVRVRGEGIFERWVKGESLPYGGKKAPVIVYHDWREALVGVAAHEFHHIRQFQNKARCVEAYCERAAAEALERYREAIKIGRGF